MEKKVEWKHDPLSEEVASEPGRKDWGKLAKKTLDGNASRETVFGAYRNRCLAGSGREFQ